MKAYILVAAVVLACQGCTTPCLQRKTLELSESSTDLRYREVVENLAMVACNRATLPGFSSVYAGTADVSDSVGMGLTPVPYFAAVSGVFMHLFKGALDFNATRIVKDNWSLDPVIVPEKLLAMRCACSCVLDHCVFDCCGHDVYLGVYEPTHFITVNDKQVLASSPPGYYFEVAEQLRRCIRTDWLHEGNCSHACYAASYRDKRVYVTKEGMEGLSEFALVLQKIARVEFDTVYFPKAITRTIKLTVKQADQAPKPSAGIVIGGGFAVGPSGTFDPAIGGAVGLVQPLAVDKVRGAAASDDNPYNISTISVFVDQYGYVTTGTGQYSPLNPDQPRVRKDNVGVDATLRSTISASKASP